MTIVQDGASLKYRGAHFFMTVGIILNIQIAQFLFVAISKYLRRYQAFTILHSPTHQHCSIYE